MMKKILATALALTLTFGTFALPAVESGLSLVDKFAVSASAETYGDFKYKVLDDGTIEIMRYYGNDEILTIPSTINDKKVTSIGDCAFYYYSSLTNITIPNSVTSIGYCAFCGCESLTKVTIPNGVTSIDDSAFSFCESLTSITFSDSLTSIGDSVFSNCTSLTSITFPDSLTSIGNHVFSSCTSLTNITIPNSVTSIGDSVFYNCTSLTSIIIPDTVTRIGNETFSLCTNLTSITIPNSVTSIGNNIFYSCTSLTSITVDSNNGYYSSKDGVLFNKDKTELIKYPVGNSRATYNIPNSVTIIDGQAFSFCKSLTSITIPNSVTNIGNCAFWCCESLKSITIPYSVENIDDYVFYNCISLTSITVDSNNGYYSSKDGVLFNKEQTELIQYPAKSSKTTYNIPNGVVKFGYRAFIGCSRLTSITIPNSVTSIGSLNFFNCTSLTSITIPNSVTSIDYEAFGDCTNLKDVYYSGTESEWNNIEISYWGNESLTNATIHYNSTGDTQKNISTCTITLPTTTQYFRGTRIRPVVTIKDGSKTLKSGTDYTVSYTNNLSVGKATVTITGKGSYAGTVTKNFDIVQRSIGNCDVELGAANYYFNGTRIKPSVKVYCNGVEMYNGNYDVAYTNNLSAGTATVTLTGKKNLKGTVTKTFKIAPRNIANCTVTLTKNSTNKYKPNVSVKIGSNAVYNGNYTVKYVTSSDKKTVKVTITGKNNLAGSVTKTYTVA